MFAYVAKARPELWEKKMTRPQPTGNAVDPDRDEMLINPALLLAKKIPNKKN